MRIDPEFKKLIPPLVPDEKDRLRANLKRDGCRDALVVWKEEDILLDGHNRLEICEEEGIEYRTATISLPDRMAAEIWILENQAGRRNLNVSQFAILALDLKELYAVEAKKRQLAGLVQYSDVQNDTSVPADSAGTGGIGRESRERAAEKYNISPRSVESASVVKKRGVPELFDAVKAGEVTVSAAEMVSRLTPESQRKVLTAGADAVKKASTVIDALWRNEKVVPGITERAVTKIVTGEASTSTEAVDAVVPQLESEKLRRIVEGTKAGSHEIERMADKIFGSAKHVCILPDIKAFCCKDCGAGFNLLLPAPKNATYCPCCGGNYISIRPPDWMPGG